MFGGAVVVCEARLRGVEERVRGVPPARRRREAERVRHELSLISIAKLTAFIRLANMSSTIMMRVRMTLINLVVILVLVA